MQIVTADPSFRVASDLAASINRSKLGALPPSCAKFEPSRMYRVSTQTSGYFVVSCFKLDWPCHS